MIPSKTQLLARHRHTSSCASQNEDATLIRIRTHTQHVFFRKHLKCLVIKWISSRPEKTQKKIFIKIGIQQKKKHYLPSTQKSQHPTYKVDPPGPRSFFSMATPGKAMDMFGHLFRGYKWYKPHTKMQPHPYLPVPPGLGGIFTFPTETHPSLRTTSMRVWPGKTLVPCFAAHASNNFEGSK